MNIDIMNIIIIKMNNPFLNLLLKKTINTIFVNRNRKAVFMLILFLMVKNKRKMYNTSNINILTLLNFVNNSTFDVVNRNFIILLILI